MVFAKVESVFFLFILESGFSSYSNYYKFTNIFFLEILK